MHGDSAGLRADAVAVLREWRPEDDVRAGLRSAYLDHLAAHPDGMYRECVPGHVTASAAVLDEAGTRVLLTLHGKLRMWLQTGGHCEPGDATLSGAALREASEESGIEDLRLLPGPITLDQHWVGCHGGAWHYDVQYAAVAPEPAEPTISEESLDLAWFPVDALPESADASVRRLITLSTKAVRSGADRPPGPIAGSRATGSDGAGGASRAIGSGRAFGSGGAGGAGGAGGPGRAGDAGRAGGAE